MYVHLNHLQKDGAYALYLNLSLHALGANWSILGEINFPGATKPPRSIFITP